jgi:putative serine protease PepD
VGPRAARVPRSDGQNPSVALIFVPVEEPEEEPDAGAPPDPLDRVWFHPSEVGAAMAAWRSGGAGPPSPPRRREWGFAAVVAVLSVVATVGVLALAGAFSGERDTTSRASVATALPNPPELRDWADVTGDAAPSIVSVRVDGPTGETLGSGVALDGSRVLTSASLVGQATTITVASHGGHLSAARVLGSDAATDVTLLLVNDGNLTAARLDHSDELRVGDSILALGLDGDSQPQPAQGIVSALHKVSPLPAGGVLPSLVATNATVPAIDGGGALIDSNGGVVGILSAALPGNAVPIDLAQQVALQLENGGQVQHGWLGVAAVDATSRPGGGAQITVVIPGSPGAQAGLVPGDVVTQISTSEVTQRVNDAGDLVASVEELNPGDPVTITAWRGSSHPDLHQGVMLTNRPSPAPLMLGIAA